MRKLIFTSSIILALAVQADRLSPEQALARFAEQHPGTRAMTSIRHDGDYELSATIEDNALYIFNSESGFIILDSEDADLVAYGDSRTDGKSISPSMSAVLKAYAASPRPAFNHVERAEIPVLLSSKWDQNDPYYLSCPTLSGKQCVTGCLATAIAQVLYHPSNRPTPRGKHEYRWQSGSTYLAYDYDAKPFEWSKMLDSYTEEASDEARRAVADMTYGVGVACEMDYHYHMSGAQALVGAGGMFNYLGCDKSLRVLERDFFTTEEWIEMLHDQLSTGRPMVYTGVSSDGGHAFVCDGYQDRDGTPYFHINWGWGGTGDGYFDISRLNPDYKGTGGGTSSDGFNLVQSAFFDVKPDEGSTDSQIDFWLRGSLKSESATSTRLSTVVLSFEGCSYFGGGGCISGCTENVNAVVGFKYINTADGTHTYRELTQPTLFMPGTGFAGFELPCQLLPNQNGTYICKLALKVNGIWHDAHEELANLGDLCVTLQGNDVNFSFVDRGQRLRVEIENFGGYVVRNESTALKVNFTAGKEDVKCEATPVITTSSGKVLWSQSAKPLEVAYGETVTLEWDEPFGPSTRRGSYMLVIKNQDGDNISEPIKVNVVNESPMGDVEELTCEPEATEYYLLDGRKLKERPSQGTPVIEKTPERTRIIMM